MPMNNTTLHTDNDNWLGLLQGNKEALYRLYKDYYHILFFTGLRHVRDANLVKDVIQQQFLYFWEKRHSMIEARNVRSYIIISFLRRLTNDWIKAKKIIHLEVAWSEKEEEIIEISCEERLIVKEYNEFLRKNMLNIVNSLPARQRELITMKFYEGLSYDAIVEKTGLTPRTVYNKIHEALNKIRQSLQQTHSATHIMD